MLRTGKRKKAEMLEKRIVVEFAFDAGLEAEKKPVDWQKTKGEMKAQEVVVVRKRKRMKERNCP